MSPRAFFISGNGEARLGALLSVIVLIGAAVVIESCAVLRVGRPHGGDDVLKFSHSAHAQYVQDCASCHLDKETNLIGQATHASCVECHAGAVPIDDNIAADESCLLCHHSMTPVRSKGREHPDYGVANFDHESHESVSCAVCHGEVNKSGFMGRINFPSMEDCVSCHFPGIGQVAAADCFMCHARINTETLPENHTKPDWKNTAHGKVQINNPDLCLRCHEPPRDCETCHSMERPPSHTAVFRAKTHGFHALDNPMSCQTCHAQDFCEACHRTTEPQSHTASFKGKPYLHCATCHLPVEEGNRCAVCHQGNPHERVFANPPPPDLVASGEIRLDQPCLPCHPVETVPITHPYNTISALECIICHRPL